MVLRHARNRACEHVFVCTRVPMCMYMRLETVPSCDLDPVKTRTPFSFVSRRRRPRPSGQHVSHTAMRRSQRISRLPSANTIPGGDLPERRATPGTRGSGNAAIGLSGAAANAQCASGNNPGAAAAIRRGQHTLETSAAAASVRARSSGSVPEVVQRALRKRPAELASGAAGSSSGSIVAAAVARGKRAAAAKGKVRANRPT